MKYRSRFLEKTFLKYLRVFPVVGITGPRQSGKSTMLQRLLGDTYSYVTFDDFQMVSFFYDDPEKFMQTYNNRIIFDEVQKVPELFSHVKLAVDRDRDNYGKFVLTGSSQFALLRQISESLAGRIGLLTLLPFQYAELPVGLRSQAVLNGCYPELVNRHYEFASEWYSAYLDTYVDKDIRLMHNIGDARDFHRFVTLLAANVGNLLNLSRFARDLGVVTNTIRRWISVLEASYIVFLLPPYLANGRKRVTKSPKVYFYDTGLVAYLAGIRSQEMYERGPMAGSLFENYIVAEVVKRNCHAKLEHKISFYRTSHGVEIDLIVETAEGKEVIEIKNSATFKSQMIKPIEQFLEPGDRGMLLYQGKKIRISDTLAAMPYGDYLG